MANPFEQVVPDLTTTRRSITGAFLGGNREIPYIQDNEPLSIPSPFTWQSIPQGWEALRYAQAAVPRSPSLMPPIMHVMSENNGAGAMGATIGAEIGLTKKALNVAAMPYIAPESVPQQTLANFSPVLAHELTHYLINQGYRTVGASSPENYAQQIYERLGSYNPLFTHNAANSQDNFHEKLANRVGTAYGDAQVIGQKVEPILNKWRNSGVKSGVDSKLAPVNNPFAASFT